MGDLVPGCFQVPQNPFTQGAGNCPRFGTGQGFVSSSIPSMGVSTIPTSLPVSSAWLLGGGNASTVSTVTSTPMPGAPSSALPKATTQASPSITQTTATPVGFGSDRGGFGDGVYKWGPSSVYAGQGYNGGWNGNATPDNSKIPVNPSVLLQPLPKVVTGGAVNLKCEDGGVSGWVGKNPILAGLALIGLYMALR